LEKIKNINFFLAIKNSKQAFFMPTVMAFLLILISFLSFQIYQTVNLYKMVNQYHDYLYYQEGITKMVNENKRVLKNNLLTVCLNVSPTPNQIETSNYVINSKGYCLKNPSQLDGTVDKSAKKINEYKQTFINSDIYVTTQEYNKLIENLDKIMALELNEDWIGIPLDDPVPSKEDLVRIAFLQKMEDIIIIDNNITTEHFDSNILVFMNARTQQILKVIYDK